MNRKKNMKLKCVETYEEVYHQEPFDVAFCPYRISPLEHILIISMARLMDWLLIREYIWHRKRVSKKKEEAKYYGK